MNRLFIEATAFTNALKATGSTKILAELQMLILENPVRGDLIQGTGGMRKMRLADPTRGKGKRGGFRVIYFDLENLGVTHLIFIYDKDQADTLSSDQKNTLKKVATTLKSVTEKKK